MRLEHRSRISTGLLAGGLLLALCGPAGADGRERRGPPPQAIEACEGAAAEAACSFEGRRGRALTGTCLEKREQIVCVPEGHSRRRGDHSRHECRGEEEADAPEA